MEAWVELQGAKKDLNTSLEEMEIWGIKLAQKEHDYKVLLKQEVMKMKAEGIAVGIVEKTCYGLENVAQERLERDIAKIKYDVAKEKVNACKLNIRVLDNEAQRDWSING